MSFISRFYKQVFGLGISFAVLFSLFAPWASAPVQAANSCSEGNTVALKGVTMDAGTSATTDYALNIFKNDFNMNTVRVWQSMNVGYDKNGSRYFIVPDKDAKTIQLAKDLKSKGFKVMMVFASKATSTIPTAQETYAFFNTFANKYADLVDYWEMQNEPNLSNYWLTPVVNNQTAKAYIDNFQRPAYNALHVDRENPEYVVSSAIAGVKEGVQRLIDNGLLTVTDAVAYHPYGDGGYNVDGRIQEHINKVQWVHDYIEKYRADNNIKEQKPLFITEWNIHYKYHYEKDKKEPTNDPDGWASAFAKMYAGIKGCVTGIWYYHSMFDPGTSAGPAGIFMKDVPATSAGNVDAKGLADINGDTQPDPNQPFYSQLRKVFYNNAYGANAPVLGNLPASTPGPSPTIKPTTSPSQTPKPTVSPTVKPTTTVTPSPTRTSTPSPSVTPTPTPTPSPSTAPTPSPAQPATPVPAMSSTCPVGSSVPIINVAWQNVSETKSVNVNISDKSNMESGWFYNTTGTSLKVDSFSPFSNYGGAQRPALQPNTTYQVSILYVPSGKRSAVGQVTTAQCQPIQVPTKPTMSTSTQMEASASGIPAPFVVATCSANSNNPTLTFNWTDTSGKNSGYNINVTHNSNFNNGGWFVKTNDTKFTTSNFNEFSKFSGGLKPDRVESNKRYIVSVLYIGLGKTSGIAAITTPDCSTAKVSQAQPFSQSMLASVQNAITSLKDWIRGLMGNDPLYDKGDLDIHE